MMIIIIPYSTKREDWKSKELQTCDLFAYNIQTYDIYYNVRGSLLVTDNNGHTIWAG